MTRPGDQPLCRVYLFLPLSDQVSGQGFVAPRTRAGSSKWSWRTLMASGWTIYENLDGHTNPVEKDWPSHCDSAAANLEVGSWVRHVVFQSIAFSVHHHHQTSGPVVVQFCPTRYSPDCVLDTLVRLRSRQCRASHLPPSVFSDGDPIPSAEDTLVSKSSKTR